MAKITRDGILDATVPSVHFWMTEDVLRPGCSINHFQLKGKKNVVISAANKNHTDL